MASAQEFFYTLLSEVAPTLNAPVPSQEASNMLFDSLTAPLSAAIVKLARLETTNANRRAFDLFCSERQDKEADAKEHKKKLREDWKALTQEQRDAFAHRKEPTPQKRKRATKGTGKEKGKEKGKDKDKDKEKPAKKQHTHIATAATEVQEPPLPWTTTTADVPFVFSTQ